MLRTREITVPMLARVGRVGAIDEPATVTLAAPGDHDTMIDRRIFAKKLTTITAAKDVSRDDVLVAMNEDPVTQTTRTTVGRWFRGEATPDMYQIQRIAEMTDTTVEWLASPSDSPLPEPNLTLTDSERQLLWLSRKFGTNIAIDRVLGVPTLSGDIKKKKTPD